MNNTLDTKHANLYLLILLISLSLTIKLTSNIIFFRQAYLSQFLFMQLSVASSALIYPLFYIINDIILSLTNKKFAIMTITLVTLFNGVFALYLSDTNLIPNNLPWKLFRNDIIGMIFTNILELLIFNYFITKIRNFFISALLSVSLVLASHNFIAYYFTLRQNPNWFNIYIDSLIVEVSATAMYLILVQFIIFTKKPINLLKSKREKNAILQNT